MSPGPEGLAGWTLRPGRPEEAEHFGHLLPESEAAGIRFLARFAQALVAGQARLDGPGEGLWFAWHQGRIEAMVALTPDPYLQRPEVGRIRHLYVAEAHRRQGLASALVALALETGHASYALITLRALDAPAAAFYRRVGFHEGERFEHATHWWPLRPLPPTLQALSPPPS